MERHLEGWERVHASRPWGLYPSEDLVRFMTRTFRDVSDRENIRVLDVGCGPGANLVYLGREGFSISGIDGSRTALQKAEQRFVDERIPGYPERVELVEGNFATLPWPDGTFDVAIDMESIYANPMDVIRSCIDDVRRVLKPGGWFFAKMFGTKTTGYGTGERVEENTSRNPTEGPCGGYGFAHFFTEEEVRTVLSGFESLSIDWLHRSDRSGSVSIFEWIVSARK